MRASRTAAEYKREDRGGCWQPVARYSRCGQSQYDSVQLVVEQGADLERAQPEPRASASDRPQTARQGRPALRARLRGRVWRGFGVYRLLTRAAQGARRLRIVGPGCGEGEPWVLYHIVMLIFGARPVLRPAPEPLASASGRLQTALRGQAGVSGRRIEQLCADL